MKPPQHAGDSRFVHQSGDWLAGRYVCEKLLGSGGMGDVFLVRDQLEHGRPVALKLLRPDVTKPDWIALLKTEFSGLARLHHPGLVDVYEFGVDPSTGLHFFTLEALDGSTLLPAAESLGPAALIDLTAQVLRALAFIHSHGFIHHDIKPKNIFVTRDNQVKLLDFALMGTAGQNGLHKGTPDYAAPEMIRLEPVDRRLDLYSLGATMYHCLAGHPPFSGPLKEVLQGHLHRVPQPLNLRGELAGLERFVFRLLCKRPEDRYFSAEHALLELARLTRREAPARLTDDSYLLTPRIIGRSRELREVRAALDAVARPPVPGDRPVLVLVSGESGLGKSRLINEIEVDAQLRELTVAVGHCVPRVIRPLQAWREILGPPVIDCQQRFPELLQTHELTLSRLLPALLLSPRSASEPPPLPGSLESGIVDFLLAYSEKRPLVVHVADLQWAGPLSVRTLDLLTRELLTRRTTCRIVVYGTFRPQESRGQPWGEALERLQNTGGVHTLSLLPLNLRAVRRILAAMLGAKPVAEQLAENVAQMTRGNPLFVEETVRYLLDWGLLVPKSGRYELMGRLSNLPFPTNVTQTLSMAFDALPAPETALLQALAVWGRPVEASLLASVLHMTVQRLAELARDLSLKHFLSRSWTEKEFIYALRHDQFSEHLYLRLSGEERAELHLSVARTLKPRLRGEPEPGALTELAIHYSEGAKALSAAPLDRERALRCCLRAGQLALELHSEKMATDLFRRARQLRDLCDAAGESIDWPDQPLADTALEHSDLVER